MTTPEQDTTPPVEHEDGIYFGMPIAEYLADPALGSSSIVDLNISPITYWRNSHMNPDREREDSDDMSLGTAFHTRLLEGREVFGQRYAPKLDPATFPDALDTQKQLAARCKELGLKVTGTKPEQEARILEVQPEALIWSRIESEYGRLHHGKTLLSAETIRKVEGTAAMVAAHPDAGRALSGGHPEVSIFWRDAETDVRCKGRLDYLKPRVVTDLKSFANKNSAPIDRAIASQMGRHGYLAQAAHYWTGLETVKQGLRAKENTLTVRGIDDDALRFVDQLAAAAPHRFLFVFVESCPYPAIRVRECSRTIGSGNEESLYWKHGQAMVRRALETYSACLKSFGPHRPWVDVAPMTAFTDEELFFQMEK